MESVMYEDGLGNLRDRDSEKTKRLPLPRLPRT